MKLFTSITFYGFLVCLMTGVSVLGQSNHLLQLYDGFSSTGSWVNINNYVDNLQSLSFNDIASSLCVPRGIWILYENPTYNTFFLGSSAFFWGENYCANIESPLNNMVSSVRYAGSPWDFKADALNIYQVEWYQSFEDFAESDNPNMIGYSGSLIVTGRSYWTLYDSPNYTGYRVCVSSADLTFANPGFYPYADDFGFRGRGIRSVRKGCWTADRSVYQPNMKIEPGKIYSNTKTAE